MTDGLTDRGGDSNTVVFIMVLFGIVIVLVLVKMLTDARRRRERIRQTTKTNDSEFDADLTEKQVFCTAEGCKRE